MRPTRISATGHSSRQAMAGISMPRVTSAKNHSPTAEHDEAPDAGRAVRRCVDRRILRPALAGRLRLAPKLLARGLGPPPEVFHPLLERGACVDLGSAPAVDAPLASDVGSFVGLVLGPSSVASSAAGHPPRRVAIVARCPTRIAGAAAKGGLDERSGG